MPKLFCREIEKSDALQLLLTILMVPLTWLVFFQWPWGDSISAHDALSMHFPVLRDFLAQGADWKKILYRPQVMGGVAVHDLGLLYLPFTFFGKLGLSPVAVLNFTLFLFQSAFSFASARLAIDLCGYFENRTLGSLRPVPFTHRLGLVWLTAFAPIVGWRIAWGHPNLILGTFPLLFSLALVVSAIRGTLGVIFGVTAAICIWMAFPSAGQQMIAYGAIFGVPLVLGFLWPHRKEIFKGPAKWAFATVGLCAFGALGIAMLRYAGILHIHFTGDLARQTDGSAVYSFSLISLRDLLGAFPWGGNILTSEKPWTSSHEYQLTIGPLILCLALIPWKRIPKFALACATVFLICFAFSIKTPPFDLLFANAYSPLAGFRCPHRSLLLLALFVPALASAGLLYRIPLVISKRALVATAGAGTLGIVLIFLPSMVREVAAWIVVAGILAVVFRKQTLMTYVTPALLLLGLLSVAAFSERLVPFAPRDTLEHSEEAFSSDFLAHFSAYRNPYYRVIADVTYGGFGVNTPYGAGLSSINGYWYPSLRFLGLACLVEDGEVRTTTQVLAFPRNAYATEVFRQLYNVGFDLNRTEKENSFRVHAMAETAGPAWFSASVTPLESLSTIANTLRGTLSNTHRKAKETTFVDSSDPAVKQATLPTGKLDGCDKAVAGVPIASLGGQVTDVAVSTSTSCPLTLSTNYFSNLVAVGTGENGKTESLVMFPSFGSLVGVWVPAGTKSVRISAVAYQPAWAWLLFFTGIAAWCGAVYCFVNYRRSLTSLREQPQSGLPAAAA